jgi:hypothetical protein
VTDDRDALIQLDRALDELAVGADPPAPATAGEATALTALAAELRAAVPAPPPGAAGRGRAALLAAASAPPAAAHGRGRPARRAGAGAPLPAVSRGRRFGRVGVLAAALLLAVTVPAALAGRALPGTPLWPLRQAGQQVRLGLVTDPVQRAHLRLDTAAMLLAAARDSGGYRRAGLAACREQIQAAMAQLAGRAGPEAAAERARAEDLLADLDSQERSVDGRERGGPGADDRSGPGGRGPGGSGGGGGGDHPGRPGGPSGSGGLGDG